MVLRSVFALGVVLGVVAHGVKVAWVVGDGVAVGVCALVVVLCGCSCVRSCSDRGDGVAVGGCALVVVLGVFAHGVELLRSGRGCGGSVWRVCSQLRSCQDC